ncbi:MULTISPECIES: C40 family peptidase [Bacillus]|uniref:C40 family peptidase n=1 Tax=Bacillus TaxID=1386 RepID=UPI000BB6FE66|nr:MULTISPECIES: C40 family peptidase [Bacillus]
MKKTIIAGTFVATLLFSSHAMAADYTVKSGDSLWKIANDNQVTVNDIRNWNNLTNDIIFPGQTLKVSAQASTTTYRVVSGDSLSVIARKYNTTTQNLLNINPTIQNANQIFVGQVLNVPSTGSNTVSTPTATTTYTIRSGDSLSVVAQRHGVTYTALLAANSSITDPNRIFVGQVINIPSGGGQVAPVVATPTWEQRADAVINAGRKYLGATYLYGAATTRTDAFDCSSYTVRVFSEIGINLPRTSGQQANVGTEIPLSQVRKGDLVFFDTSGNGVINHVSIIVDQNTLLHSASSTGVAFANYNTYWKPRAVKAVRVIQ